jgi:uncharacterized protein YpuA (DUF1002 family)
MSNQQQNIFDKISGKSNLQAQDILQVADSVKNANFSDEQTVRQLIKQLSVMANVTITKEKEEQIVNAVVNNNVPLDFNTLSNMLNKK